MTVDELAQIIRKVDGENTMGAGALAEAILDTAPSASMGRVTDEMVDEAQAVLQQWGMEHGARTAARLALQAALDSPPDHGGGEP